MTRTNAPRASETERKERRRAANRKSARKSRFRENVLMDELQKTVNDLGKHNQTLKSENDTFKEEITALQSLLACHAKSQQLQPKKLSPILYQSGFNDGLLQQPFSIAKAVSRTPSPVESFNLNQLDPDRIFPLEGGIRENNSIVTMLTAEDLFRAALFTSGTTV